MEVIQQDTHLTHVVLGQQEEVVQATMEVTPHLFQMFSSGLYTDQRLAVVREVMCNGWDIHIQMGITHKPLVIHFDRLSHVLSFQDSGCGLSYEDMKKFYITYNASSKRGSTNQTGGFGIGCKSPFAYVDTFGVDSHHNGTKTVYQLAKRGDDGSYIPTLQKIVEVPTDRTGITVSIQLRSGEWSTFQDLIKEVAFKGQIPTILTVDDAVPGEPLPMLEMNHKEGFVVTTISSMFSSKVNVRVGNVVYPIKPKTANSAEFSEVCEMLSRSIPTPYAMVMQAPGGTISMTPNREELSMVPKTVANLMALMKAALVRYTKPLNPTAVVEFRNRIENEAVEHMRSTFRLGSDISAYSIYSDGCKMSTLRPHLVKGATTYEDRLWVEAYTKTGHDKFFKHVALIYVKAFPEKAGNIMALYRAMKYRKGFRLTLKKIHDRLEKEVRAIEPKAELWALEANSTAPVYSMHALLTASELRYRSYNLVTYFDMIVNPMLLTSRMNQMWDQQVSVKLSPRQPRLIVRMPRTAKWAAMAEPLLKAFPTMVETVHEPKVRKPTEAKNTILPNTMNVIKKHGFAPLASALLGTKLQRPEVPESDRITNPDYYYMVPKNDHSDGHLLRFMKDVDALLTANGMSVGVVTSPEQELYARGLGIPEMLEELGEALANPALYSYIKSASMAAWVSDHSFFRYVKGGGPYMDLIGTTKTGDEETYKLIYTLLSTSRYYLDNPYHREFVRVLDDARRSLQLDFRAMANVAYGGDKMFVVNNLSTTCSMTENINWLYHNFLKGSV